jgi:hypothetical protein
MVQGLRAPRILQPSIKFSQISNPLGSLDMSK